MFIYNNKAEGRYIFTDNFCFSRTFDFFLISSRAYVWECDCGTKDNDGWGWVLLNGASVIWEKNGIKNLFWAPTRAFHIYSCWLLKLVAEPVFVVYPSRFTEQKWTKMCFSFAQATLESFYYLSSTPPQAFCDPLPNAVWPLPCPVPEEAVVAAQTSVLPVQRYSDAWSFYLSLVQSLCFVVMCKLTGDGWCNLVNSFSSLFQIEGQLLKTCLIFNLDAKYKCLIRYPVLIALSFGLTDILKKTSRKSPQNVGYSCLIKPTNPLTLVSTSCLAKVMMCPFPIMTAIGLTGL